MGMSLTRSPLNSTDEALSLWFELGALPRWNRWWTCVRCVNDASYSKSEDPLVE